MRTKKLIVNPSVAVTGILAAALCLSTANADHFKPLSPDHASYGVGQLNYGNTPHDTQFPLKLMNPVHVDQVSATLVYQSDRSFEPLPPAVYRNCVVRTVPAHGSIGVEEDAFYPTDDVGNLDEIASYVEIIWAPVSKVGVGKGNGANRRIADGLGGWGHAARDSIPAFRIAHPGLFSLPSDDVVAGQRAMARDCICGGLAGLGLDGDTFSDFGIACN